MTTNELPREPPSSTGWSSPPQAGDRPAFDELVRRTYVDTYTLALRLTADEEDARDVVQEAYLRAWKGLDRFRGDAQFTTWMYRITANTAYTTVEAPPAAPRRVARACSTTSIELASRRAARGVGGDPGAARPGSPARSSSCRRSCGCSSC